MLTNTCKSLKLVFQVVYFISCLFNFAKKEIFRNITETIVKFFNKT